MYGESSNQVLIPFNVEESREKTMKSRFQFSVLGLITLGILNSSTGCFAITDLDRFQKEGQNNGDGSVVGPGQFLNLRLAFQGYTPHLIQKCELWVIDNETNIIQFRGIYEELGPIPDAAMFIPKAVPSGKDGTGQSNRLDWYADMNGSKSYDGIGSVTSNDHAWRRNPLTDLLPASASPKPGTIEIIHQHDTNFTELDTFGEPSKPVVRQSVGGSAKVVFSGMSIYQDKLLNVRVAVASSGHTVGMYRIPRIKTASFETNIPGITETNEIYNIYIFIDAQNPNFYDNPAENKGDLGWQIPTQQATENGLTIDFSPNSGPGNYDVVTPF